MNTNIATSWDEFARLRDDWNRLSGDIPTRSWEWLSGWWKSYGIDRNLRIIVVRDDLDVVCGIAPFYLERRGPLCELRFLGSGKVCSDYSGLLLDEANEFEGVRAIFRAITRGTDSLGRQLSCACIQFDGVDPTESWIAEWNDLASEQGYRLQTKQLENCWRVPLPTTVDEIAKLTHSHVRRKYKKAAGRLSRGEVSLRICDAESAPHMLETLERLHMARQQSKGMTGCFSDPRFGKFLQVCVPSMIDSNKAQLVGCRREGNCFAIQLQLLGKGGVWMYQSGLDPSEEHLEPGHLLITGSLIASVESGAAFYDFMRGDEPYKSQWGANPTRMERITYIPDAWLPRLVHTTNSWLRVVRDWSKTSAPVAVADTTTGDSLPTH